MSDSSPWPPPPDLASIRVLVRAADPEDRIAQGGPQDAYQDEENQLFAAVAGLPTGELVATKVLPLLEPIWQRGSSLSDQQLAECRPRLLSLAKEIERLFGPDSRPRTRTQILGDQHLADEHLTLPDPE